MPNASHTRRVLTAALAIAALLVVPAHTARATEISVQAWWGTVNHGTWNPADPLVAAGPRGLLRVDNGLIRYTAKNGEQYPDYTNVGTRDFFTPPSPPNILNDPRVLYDPQSERFFVTCSDFAASGPIDTTLRAYLSIAVSTNSHPRSLADWVHHRFDVTRFVGSGASQANHGPDYPQIGIDAHAFHVTGNWLRLPIGSGGQHGVGILTFPKAQLLAGGPVTPSVTSIDVGNAFALQPVSEFWSATGLGNVSYFVETPFGAPTSIRLWALADPLGARTLTSTLLAVPNHGQQVDLPAPQAGTTARIRSWSGVSQAMAQWRNGEIWFAATGDTVESGIPRARAHWYRIAANAFPSGTPSLVETGVVDGGPGEWTFLPALGLTPRGDVGIVFQQSSTTTRPTMRFIGRAAAASAFAAPLTVKVGPGSNTFRDYPFVCPSCNAKWGDDYTVSADPADSSLWLSCQLARSDQPGDTPMWIHETANVIFDDNLPAWPAAGRRVRRGQSAVAALSIAPDDSGGIYLGWHDSRMVDDVAAMIFAQRVTPTGAHAGGWRTNGNAVQMTGGNAAVRTVSDGNGGAYLYYLTASGPTVMCAIRLGRQGTPAPGWTGPVLVATSVATTLDGAPDGAGGMLAAYVSSGLRIQRVAPNGALLWASPVQVTASAAQVSVVGDQAGGAFVSWTAAGRVRLQHLVASGSLDPVWPPTGLDLGLGSTPRIVADGAGGVFVAFASSGDILARRHQADGAAPAGWADPVVVCGAPGTQAQPAAAADGAGGLLVTWADLRDPASEADIYAHRVTGAGVAAAGWSVDGLRLCHAPGEQGAPALAADGGGGVVVAWTDARATPGCAGTGCGSDIYWSHAAAGGVVDPFFGPDGAPAGIADGEQWSPSVVRTGTGAAIVAWLDGRSTPDGDPVPLSQVFAQRLLFATPNVDVPVEPPAAVADGLGPPRPNPTATGVRFDITVSASSAGGTVELGAYDVGGRLVRRILAAPVAAGVQTLGWDLTDGAGRRVPTGRYFLRVRIAGRTYTRALSVR